MKRILKVIIAVIIGVTVFFGVDRLLKTNWNYKVFIDDMGFSYQGFANLEDNSVQVLFMGASHMSSGISPMQIYKDEKLTTYNLSTSKQPIEGTYYLLKEAFKTQTPKVVVMDVSSLLYDTEEDWDNEQGMRYVIDLLPFSMDKIECAKVYASMCKEDGDEKFWSALFPFLQYHGRWAELNVGDFVGLSADDTHCLKGAFYSPAIVGSKVKSVEKMNAYLEGPGADEVDWQVGVSDNAKDYLRKIKAMCDENGSKLLLTKIPTVAFPRINESAWTSRKYECIKQLAKEEELDYVDMLYDTDLALDMKKDYRDKGFHLNYKGIQKTTAFMGKYLMENYSLTPAENPEYEADMDKYENICRMAEFEMEDDPLEYLSTLNENKDHYVICIVSQLDCTEHMTKKTAKALKALGLKANFIKDVKYADSYIAVIDCGTVVEEQYGKKTLNYTYKTADEVSIELTSNGRYAGVRSSISVNGYDYAVADSGLNIVVYDTNTGTLVDSVDLNTNSPANPVNRNPEITQRIFMIYEHTYLYNVEYD